jgi:hypothetical protein
MFDGVDLEDSWVLGWYVDVGHNRLVFGLEASLWPGHEYYVPPSPAEHTCYKRARLCFERVASIDGLSPMDAVKPNVDPDGSIDYGNIEGLHQADVGIYKFGGDFGEVIIKCEGVRLELADADGKAAA